MFKNIATIIKRNYACNHNNNILNILKSGQVGTEIVVQGWVKSMRNQKENVFIDINDGSTDKKLQIFIPQKITPYGVNTGSSIRVMGVLKHSPKGQLELNAENIDLIGECVLSKGYPFMPRKQYTLEYIRQYLQFRPRTNKFSSMLRVRSAANLAIHNFFCNEGFLNVQSPILTSNDCEGAGEVFKVIPESKEIIKSMIKEGLSLDEGFFNTKAFLSVSGQLHLEAACHGLGSVYTFGPTFRAENSRSRLHLSEFYMLEAEKAFIENIDGIMKIIESLLKSITQNILDTNQADIEVSSESPQSDFHWLDKKFNVLTYDEAVKILENNKNKYKEPFDTNDGFAKEHEIFLVSHLGNIPTFVINWPKNMKPFYMREFSDNTEKVSALDLLVPNVGELVGGSLRENSYEKLKEKIPEGTNLDWYLDLRKFGGVPTGGFGMGFERYIQFITGITNIKDVIPFPRWPHNCSL
ncbi:unnamed protein product [Brassicogethes aeneus]|uniref:asparagine--tRNA ligase n=1 Tax=Brassicogethes aeneus TaxID=1431903 RepID=A0A9P0FMH6_BRAAE|nr:unnamed protein product [Brassicogethes aeneus]